MNENIFLHEKYKKKQRNKECSTYLWPDHWCPSQTNWSKRLHRDGAVASATSVVTKFAVIVVAAVVVGMAVFHLHRDPQYSTATLPLQKELPAMQDIKDPFIPGDCDDDSDIGLIENNGKQESPPAWTQEAYRPPFSQSGWGCGQTEWWTDTCENITFPHPSDVVGKKESHQYGVVTHSRVTSLMSCITSSSQRCLCEALTLGVNGP